MATVAPYGRWASAISAGAATAGTKTLTSPRSVRHSASPASHTPMLFLPPNGS